MVHKALLGGLLVACLCSSALGFVVPDATLNMLTKQATITTLTNVGNKELNPYGLAAIKQDMFALKKGNFLATQWNDAGNKPGQGATILQVTPNGQVGIFAVIEPQNQHVAAACNANVGVGLTMALVILSKGYVIVGSTPVAANGIAAPGCLIVLDAKGTVLDARAANELTSDGKTMTGGGPWGMAVQEYNKGTNANLFVSYVLGNDFANANQINAGMVVRYGLQLPGGGFTEKFWNGAPDIIASGFPTQPANIAMGKVGPAGLLVGGDPDGYKSYSKKYVSGWDNTPLFIANTLGNSVHVVSQANQCFPAGQGTPTCTLQNVANDGVVNGPIGLCASPQGTIIGANGNIGTLFEIAPLVGKNMQLADQFVDNGADGTGAGDLFNCVFLAGKKQNTLYFNDDGSNTFMTLSSSGGHSSHHSRKLMAA